MTKRPTTNTKKEMRAYRATSTVISCHACGATRTTLRKIAPGRYACPACR